MESFFRHMKQEMEIDPEAPDAEIEKIIDIYNRLQIPQVSGRIK